jgi:MFS family permease
MKAQAPWRTQGSVYAVGFFASSLTDVASIVLPVWLASQGASAATIGVIIGAKHILPFFLAIHGGALMDRFGARRLMIFCAMLSVIALPLFPVAGWLPAVFALQMISGFGSSMGWLGAQTLFGQALRGEHLYAGRFAFAIRMGSFTGPPLVGLAWDHLGVAGGFGFLALWALGTVVASFWTPRLQTMGSGALRGFKVRDALPRVRDYKAAFALAGAPAMTAVLLVTVIRIAASSVQDSFYPLYLTLEGFSATQIGTLMTISAAAAAASSLMLTMVTKRIAPMWALIISSAGAVVFIACTPLLHSFAALAIVAALRGLCTGVSQPLMLSMLIKASGEGSQGKGAALRTTANRAAAATTPPFMGLVAAGAGLGASFFIVGGLLLAALGAIALYLRSRPDLPRE